MTDRLPPILLALALLLPISAGCIGDDAPAPEAVPAATTATTAEDAGARAGDAPAAPRDAYTVRDEAGDEQVVHPVLLATNAARAPIELDFSDVYRPQDCRGLNMGPLETVLQQASVHRRMHDLTEHLRVGDVFQYEIRMSFENTQDNWGAIHPGFGIGNTITFHEDDVDGAVEIVWQGQALRASEDDPAFVLVQCWYGAMTRDIPYTLTVRLSFAQDAVPAETPFLLPVPEGATRLFVRGVPMDESRGVLSHFRLFGSDDALLCECALNSNQEAQVIPLEEAGDHVLIVDHTDNGFVSVAFDVPPTEPMRPLEVAWFQTLVLKAEGGPVNELVALDLGTVPLHMDSYVLSSDGGMGQATMLTLTNARGTVLRSGWAGHVTFSDTMGGYGWLGLPSATGEWVQEVDHHAFLPGAHEAHVEADFLRGDVWLVTRQYVR